MIKIFTHNWIAKVVCLLLAIGLWIYVISAEARVANFPGSLALEVRNQPENLVVVKNIDEVEIKIMAEGTLWKKLSANSFQAYIDLTGLDQGLHEVPVHVRTDLAGVQIVEVKPAKIMVSMEPVITESITVKEKIEGEAAEGMIAKSVTLTPQRVDISGPQSILEKIAEAKAMIILDGENESFSRQITIQAFNEQNEEYQNVSFNPAQVEAKVTITKAGQTKTVGLKVKIEGRLASGYWISQISTDPSTLTITGSSADLANISYLETSSINIEGLNQNKTQQINLDLPSGISLLADQSNKINIEITVSSLESSREVVAGFNYNNLSNSLKVSSVEPSSIKIILASSLDKLNSLTDSSVKINLDLASYNLANTYAIDIKENMISKPEGLRIATFVPSSVRITLENK